MQISAWQKYQTLSCLVIDDSSWSACRSNCDLAISPALQKPRGNPETFIAPKQSRGAIPRRNFPRYPQSISTLRPVSWGPETARARWKPTLERHLALEITGREFTLQGDGTAMWPASVPGRPLAKGRLPLLGSSLAARPDPLLERGRTRSSHLFTLLSVYLSSYFVVLSKNFPPRNGDYNIYIFFMFLLISVYLFYFL